MDEWTEAPEKPVVEQRVCDFFSLLARADFQAAEGYVVAELPLDKLVFGLWRLLLTERPAIAAACADDSFEGGTWRSDLSWLAAFAVDEDFEWNLSGSRVDRAGEHFYACVTYEGLITDATVDFEVLRAGGGGPYQLHLQQVR